MAYSGRFVAENEGVNGVCKVLLDEQQRVIGAHVLGNPASEIITLAGTAIELGLTAAQWKKIRRDFPGSVINGFRYLRSFIDAGILLIKSNI
jgi:pyruvate/2-oxoglutarate dehydrogenase complex dihydrolipoamide dehydrogenase (E3) component